jgi:hypothetical protein
MISQNVFYDTKDLPGNILTLVDDSFYDFIEQRLGVDRSSLLKLQQINSVPCLLLTGDPCEILNLNIDDYDLNLLKNKMCFLLYDGSFVVKPGVITGFKCLRELLTKKTEEKLKHSRNTKTQLPTAPPINILTSPPSFLTSSITTTISTSQATTTSAPQQSATTTAPQQSPPTSLSHASPSTSISEHRKYLLNLLKQWCFNHKNDFNLDSFDLNEGKDFILYVIHNHNNDLEPSIKCNCGRLIVLTVKNGKIQLSNYQKHLRTATCTHMNSLKKLDEKGKKSNRPQTTSDLSSSAAVTSAAAAPQQQQTILQVPVLVSPGASSIVIPPTSDTQSTISQTNLRKRSQPSSHLSSSQKAKRRRT